jgi:hypothetical protein
MKRSNLARAKPVAKRNALCGEHLEFLRERLEKKEKKEPGASLRGQGTPAYPARLRSERARNSPETNLQNPARNLTKTNRFQILQNNRQKTFVPQVAEFSESLACGLVSAAEFLAALRREVGSSLLHKTLLR